LHEVTVRNFAHPLSYLETKVPLLSNERDAHLAISLLLSYNPKQLTKRNHNSKSTHNKMRLSFATIPALLSATAVFAAPTPLQRQEP
jgi:hypothetical protein